MNFFPVSLLVSGLFIIIKFTNLGIRFSDSNIYFYTASEILKGRLLYKDLFFTNLPLFPYISSIYAYVLRSIDLYYLTAAVEAAMVGLLIYYLVYKKTQNGKFGLVAQIFYLGSFIVLSTSDHQTGVFLASLFSILAYYFFTEKKAVLSGIFTGFAVFTKAYYLPIFISLALYYLIKERKRLALYLLGFVGFSSIVLFPFLVFAREEMISQVVNYSLFRQQGLDKFNIVLFYIKHDFIFILLSIYSISNIRKNLLLGLIIMVSGVFLLAYKDVYYLYLNIFAPFIPLVVVDVYNNHKEKITKHMWRILSVLTVVFFINFYIYFANYFSMQKVDNIREMLNIIKIEKPKYLYGVEEIIGAVSVLSETPLLPGVTDTNENIFNSGLLNAKKLTEMAINNETIIILKGASYQGEVNDPILTSVVEEDLVYKHCRFLKEYPIKTEGAINRITMFSCKKPLD